VLLVAEEIGIVPIRSMLTELYETGFGRDARLVYWGRDPGRLAYDGEFRSLARRHPSFAYVPVVRDAPVEWRGDRGEVADAVDREVRGVDNLVAYVSGGGEKIDRVRAVLMAKGLERKSVRWERFW
jgi:NAD(P)H-flavin reductase